jgi:hypothetical protein
MTMYLVRDKETKQICGIVGAENLDHVFFHINEFADTTFYEVAPIKGAVWFCVEDEKEEREHPAHRVSHDQEPFYYSKEWADKEWDKELEKYGSDKNREDHKREREDQFRRSSYVPDPVYLDWNETVSHVVDGNEEVMWIDEE